MQRNIFQCRVHLASFLKTFLRQKSDFTLDCLVLHHAVIKFWSSAKKLRAGFTMPLNHSFQSPITNQRQRGQWLISCCLQSTLRPTEKKHSSKWQVLFIILWVNSPLLCSISLTSAIIPFLPPHSKPQRVTMQNTSVSCFMNCACTFPRGTLAWDLEESNFTYKYYVLLNLSGSFTLYYLLKMKNCHT